MVECYYMCQSDNGSITTAHALQQWSDAYISALDGIKDPRAPMQLQNLFHAAGFLEVESRMIPLPLCGWPTGTALFFLSAVAITTGMIFIPSLPSKTDEILAARP